VILVTVSDSTPAIMTEAAAVAALRASVII
jgi:hypothetical protein